MASRAQGKPITSGDQKNSVESLKNFSDTPPKEKCYVWLKKPSEVTVNNSPLHVTLHGTCNYK